MKYKLGKIKELLLANDRTAIINFLRRVNITLVGSVPVVIVFVYFLIYSPMKVELQNSLIDNFKQNADTNYHLIESTIDRGVDGASSLSSRTMIKIATQEYLNNTMSLEELRIFVKDKYIEGAKAVNNILYAERIVDNQSIAKYYNSTPYDFIHKEIDLKTLSTPMLDFIIKEKDYHGVIYSPIIINDETVGYDYVVYTFMEQLDKLCANEQFVDFMDEDKYNGIIEKAKIIQSNKDMTVLETSKDIFLFNKIQDMYFYTKQSKKDLFVPIEELTRSILMGSIIVFPIFILYFYTFIVRYAQNELIILDKSRNQFKEIAYLDQLTSSYTRQYLENWNNNLRKYNEKYSVAMIDVDNFKEINDMYGHATGDAVLKTIAETIMNYSRKSDLLIRFGGDEFLLILPNSDSSCAKELMHRIEEKLCLIEELPMPIYISYGISELTSNDTIEECIKEADICMYKNKKEKSK